MALDDDCAGGRVSEEALTRRRADNVPRGINDPERARERVAGRDINVTMRKPQ